MNGIDPQEILNALPLEYYVVDIKNREIIQSNKSSIQSGDKCFKAIFNKTSPCNSNTKQCACQQKFTQSSSLNFEMERVEKQVVSKFNVHGKLIDEGLAVLCLNNLGETIRLKEELAYQAVKNQRAEKLAHFGYWELDLSTQIFHISEGTRSIYGLDVSEISYENVRKYTHWEDLPAFDEAIKGILSKGAGANLMFRVLQAPNKNERYVKGLAELVGDKCYGILMDITDFLEASKALEENERYLKQLFENMSAGFAHHEMVLDKKGRPVDYIFLDVNPRFEELTGLKRETILNKRVKEVMPNTENEWIERYGKVALTGIPDEFENYSSELDRFYYVSAFSPVKNFFAVSFQDITTRKKAEMSILKAKEKAEESDRLKTQFMANLSHEIRTPLSGILGFSKLICSEEVEKDKLDYYGKLIEDSGLRLISVIDDILNISLIQSNELQISCEKFDCKDLLNELYELFKGSTDYQSKKIEFKVQDPFADAPVILFSDKLKVFEILKNLLNNAFKFTEAGNVVLGAEKCDNNCISFSVKDTGIGVDANMQRLIFEPFRQVEEGDSKKYEGFGIGLAIVDGLVNKLGGEVKVQSELGKGSVFTVNIPQCC